MNTIVIEGEYEGARGIPLVREPGSSVRRNTGAWRIHRPVLDRKKCVRCKMCFVICPDAAISWNGSTGPEGGPVFDYRLCKGCMLCYKECPAKAIAKVLEADTAEKEAKEKSGQEKAEDKKAAGKKRAGKRRSGK